MNRDDFDFINDNIVYLDSSSTSLKPKCIINEINEYLNEYPLSYGRGNSKYTRKINKKVDETRLLVKDFINAKKTSEIIFTSGATDSSKMISSIYGLNTLNDNDEIILCMEDHNSTIKPWLDLKKQLTRFNININFINSLIDLEGDYKENDLIDKINEKTKIIILTHIHNVYGLEMNIESLIKRIREKNKTCKIILDASQSIGHILVDVQKLDVDFLFFSAHKMFSITGCGVLYIKDNDLFTETGTIDSMSIISLGSAIKYINNIGIKKIENYIYSLTRYLYDELLKIDNVEFNLGIAKCKCALGYGIISFRLNNISNIELSNILDDYNIIVRSNNFCNNLSDNDYIRVSIHIYNNKEDIDKFIKLIKYIENNKI